MSGAAIQVDGFDVGDEVGRGGFGVVYRARQVDLDRTVALKVLPAGAPSDAARRRFEHECRIVGSLPPHPAIVPVYHAGATVDGAPFLAMAFLPGGTLAARMPLPPAQVAAIGAALADGLAVAHAGGVNHRDVKPANVLFDADDRPVLVDFGIASLVGEGTTASGSIALSLGYAPPETLDGERSGPPADVYGLGATLFAALTGAAPFTVPGGENSVAGIAARVATKPVEDLRPRGVPDALCRVIEKAMAKAPGERYASMIELREALSALGPALPGTVVAASATAAATAAAPSRPPRPARPRWLWPALAGGAAVVTGTVAVALAASSTDGPPAGAAGPDSPALSAAADGTRLAGPTAIRSSGGTSSRPAGPAATPVRGSRSTGPGRPGGGIRTVVVVQGGGGGVPVAGSTSSSGRPRASSAHPRTVSSAPRRTQTTSATASPYPTPRLAGTGRCTASGAAGSWVDVSQACPGWTADWYPSVQGDYYPCLEPVGFSSTNQASGNQSEPECDGSSWRVWADRKTTTTYRYRLRLYYLKNGKYVRGELSARTDTVTITFT